jgi:hypothetical protein
MIYKIILKHQFCKYKFYVRYVDDNVWFISCKSGVFIIIFPRAEAVHYDNDTGLALCFETLMISDQNIWTTGISIIISTGKL